MSPAAIGMIIAIFEACIKYGPSTVQTLTTALGKDEITIEDIQGLKIMKEPEEF